MTWRATAMVDTPSPSNCGPWHRSMSSLPIDSQRTGAELRRGPARGEISAPALNDQPAIVVMQRNGQALGEAIVHLPAYYAIRHAFPDHRVIGLFDPVCVFETSLARARPIFFDETRGGCFYDQSRGLAQQLESCGQVDCVFDLNTSLRAFQSYRASFRRSRRYIANAAGYGLRRDVSGFVNRRPVENSLRCHRMIEIVAGRPLPYEYQLPQSHEARQHAAALLPAGRRYFGFAPYSPGVRKAWPLDRTLAIARFVMERGLQPVFLLGPMETGLRDAIEAAVPRAIVVDMAASGNDKTYLPWLFLAVADRLTGVVCPDSGIGHLVATRNIPVLTLAGPGNAWRWKPLTPFWWLVRAQDFGSPEMDAIPIDVVQRTVSDMMRWSEERSQRDALCSAHVPEPSRPAASVGTIA